MKKEVIKPTIIDKTKGIYGHVDFINSEGIGGWVWSPEQSEPRIVEVWINNKKIYEGIADIFRPDISAIVGKEVKCGFFIKWHELEIDRTLLESEDIDIKIVDSISGLELSKKSYSTFKLIKDLLIPFKYKPPIKPKITDKEKGIYGHVDFINEQGISGWLLHADGRNAGIVEVYINNVKVAEKIADIDRADISSIMGKNVKCGFFISWGEIDAKLLDQIENLENANVSIVEKFSKREIWGKHKLNNKVDLSFLKKKKDTEHQSLETDDVYKVLEFPVFEKPQASIIIPVYNKFDYTFNCLKSIRENTKEDTPYEVILVDDCSKDETQNIHKLVRGITIVRNASNLGFLRSVNKASKIARGDYLVVLNNDIVVPPDWLSTLIKTFDYCNKIAVVGPKFIYPDGSLQEAGGIIWRDGTGWNYGRGKDPSMPEYNYVKEVDYISGACLVIKKSVWEEIGGFDERYAPAYFEDSDFAFECRKRGYKVIYQPKVEVIHFEGISHGKDTSEGIKKYQEINRHKFVEKWKDVLEAEHFPNGTDPFLARDRTFRKPHLLVIDHYVPMYDIGAGERTIYMWLKTLKDYFKITFIGENFYKHEPYTTELQQMGIEVLYGNYYALNWENWLKEHLKYFDCVLLSRAHIAKKFIKVINEHYNGPILYYPHDLSYVRLMREYEVTKNKAVLENANYQKSLEYDIISNSDIILLPSYDEMRELKKDLPFKKIVVIPAFVYDGHFPYSKNSFENRKGILFVGGFRHHPNAPSIKWFVENVWDKILSRISDTVLYIVGADCPQEIYELQNIYRNIRVLGYVSEETLKELYNSVRVVIAPLLYGAGVKGKVVEAIVHGVPIVTTSIGAEGIPDIEKVALIADGTDEFAEAVCKLYTQSDLWNKMRENTKVIVEKYFSKDIFIKTFQEVFSGGIEFLGVKLYNLQDFRKLYDTNKKIFSFEYLEKAVNYVKKFGIFDVFNDTKIEPQEIEIVGENYRETIKYNGTISRHRSVLFELKKYMEETGLRNNDIKIYSPEFITEFASFMRKHFPFYVGSELNPSIPEIPHQDLENLTFSDSSFDVVIYNDIFEHLWNIERAMMEIYRVLKAGGILIATFPFASFSEKTRIKARKLPNGQIEYLEPPEYHGDPLNPSEGSLVVSIPGWDIIDLAKSVGFSDAYICFYSSVRYGILPYNYVFVGRK